MTLARSQLWDIGDQSARASPAHSDHRVQGDDLAANGVIATHLTATPDGALAVGVANQHLGRTISHFTYRPPPPPPITMIICVAIFGRPSFWVLV